MKLVFATHNHNKLREVQALVPDHITLLSLTDIGCTEEITEDADTIEGNALLKANHVLTNYGYDCFADDTGLEVDALDGAPGVYSARYAGEQKDDSDNMNKLLINLATKQDRGAQFKTVIAFAKANKTETFTGICRGKITKERHGDGGFGYDPIFRPKGYDATFAQMAPSLKGKISHRGFAVSAFLEFLYNQE
ncbi:XTP/dITP diphosphohydrolase [Dokdonia sp. Hel_I_63]|jgi:XTP/dITP diphosphohydrolase|uniref:non-canonical purine NTP diphosphatase n=1 Tax=unclassified Dokdonia TaxID=2615033 RepID=UPI00020A6308|nr:MULTISPECIES: non-canonical purine NTP diphosphatase [unclassified Dokdonia]AEE20568.1 non-canonical purine NTP pyrophosphatase, rdgB/HAM1 family [Dokdonia sp. 4H-3-7-5]TVZ23176.1 XTP/dITP diphosphohydrolase [Dokdonia sp. Hel_I_63]